MAVPFYHLLNLIYIPSKIILEIRQKYQARIDRFQQSGNFRDMDPDGNILLSYLYSLDEVSE
jgi:hypothetical protein